MRDLVILGSTGSIGVQALEIVAANPGAFNVVAISAYGTDPAAIIEQARAYKVQVIGVVINAEIIREALPNVTVIDGPNAASEIAAITCEVVLNGITGSIGLGPTLAALEVGNKLALANKESLVAAGELVMSKASENQLIPVDSEHSAIWQSAMAGKKSEIAKLILTASGGPFRNRRDLSDVTIAEALAHPTWAMGQVVTINSATLMNKSLEIIEAHYLFELPYRQIEAVIHPQSIVHSMVEYVDGSTLAQLSPPNMKGPIAYAINWPVRLPGATKTMDWSEQHTFEFEPIDNERFPVIELARRCGELGGGLPAIFNAANEVAVAAFLAGRISFTSIVEIVDLTVQKLGSAVNPIRDLVDVSAIEN
uniref:1-deoxy-D-xylulose-5-phosphate reductoisomerase n=2 Tax=Candidatus Planktophila sp. TaxID=2175601 RepID=UPI00404ADE34